MQKSLLTTAIVTLLTANSAFTADPLISGDSIKPKISQQQQHDHCRALGSLLEHAGYLDYYRTKVQQLYKQINPALITSKQVNSLVDKVIKNSDISFFIIRAALRANPNLKINNSFNELIDAVVVYDDTEISPLFNVFYTLQVMIDQNPRLITEDIIQKLLASTIKNADYPAIAVLDAAIDAAPTLVTAEMFDRFTAALQVKIGNCRMSPGHEVNITSHKIARIAPDEQLPEPCDDEIGTAAVGHCVGFNGSRGFYILQTILQKNPGIVTESSFASLIKIYNLHPEQWFYKSLMTLIAMKPIPSRDAMYDLTLTRYRYIQESIKELNKDIKRDWGYGYFLDGHEDRARLFKIEQQDLFTSLSSFKKDLTTSQIYIAPIPEMTVDYRVNAFLVHGYCHGFSNRVEKLAQDMEKNPYLLKDSLIELVLSRLTNHGGVTSNVAFTLFSEFIKVRKEIITQKRFDALVSMLMNTTLDHLSSASGLVRTLVACIELHPEFITDKFVDSIFALFRKDTSSPVIEIVRKIVAIKPNIVVEPVIVI